MYNSLSDVVNNVVAETIDTVRSGWDGMASDGTMYVLYYGIGGDFFQFDSYNDLKNDNGTRLWLARTGWNAIASDGEKWWIFRNNADEVAEWDTYADMIGATAPTRTYLASGVNYWAVAQALPSKGTVFMFK